jgi:hypothetical protein
LGGLRARGGAPARRAPRDQPNDQPSQDPHEGKEPCDRLEHYEGGSEGEENGSQARRGPAEGSMLGHLEPQLAPTVTAGQDAGPYGLGPPLVDT